MATTDFPREKIAELIQRVHDNPCLWDKNDAYKKDVMARKNAWITIAEQMNMDNSGRSAHSSFLEELISSKWEYLRENFVKNWKKRTTPKWEFYELLEFLNDSITLRPKLDSSFQSLSEGNFEDLEASNAISSAYVEGNECSAADLASIMLNIKRECSPESSETDGGYDQRRKRFCTTVNSSTTSDCGHSLSRERQKAHSTTSHLENNEDYMFGRTIAASLAIYPRKLKSKIKAKIMQLIAETDEEFEDVLKE